MLQIMMQQHFTGLADSSNGIKCCVTVLFLISFSAYGQQICISMKLGSKNRGWCEDEDRIIVELVEKYGTKNWAQIADQLHLAFGYARKTGKQCRERWHNHLDPHIVKKSWTKTEEDILFEEHRKFGNKWTVISDRLPGRTDNSIKNHFYSTVRKSLRRISKFMGSKNSTVKMRQIKPSTLSKIFTHVESKSDQQDSNEAKQAKECRQIAESLMSFARYKLTDKKYVIVEEDIRSFQKILQEMIKINSIYENQKMAQAKIKKEKLLERNFDNVASSVEEELSEMDQERQDRCTNSSEDKGKSKEGGVLTTRSKRVVKPPVHHEEQSVQTKQRHEHIRQAKQQKHGKSYEIKEENGYAHMKSYLMSPLRNKKQEEFEMQMHEYQVKDHQLNPNEAEGNKFDFLVDLQANEQVNFREMDQLSISPGLKNTPMALTPRIYEFMRDMRDMPGQPFKNEDCNITANKIISEIQKNTNCDVELPQRPMFIPSPSSAFRQYC